MYQQLAEQKQIETRQNIIPLKDEWFLRIPDLEPEIKELLKLEKMSNMRAILIGTILTNLALYICQTVTGQVYIDFTKQSLSNDSLLNWIGYFSILIFVQGSIGFSVDLISLQTAWFFSQLISIFGVVCSIVGLQIGNSEIITLALYLANFSTTCNYILGSFILYDSSYALDKRFNYAGLFIIIGTYVPELIVFIFGFSPIERQFQQLALLILSLVIDVIGVFTVYKSYNNIDRIRNTSIEYTNYKFYRGIGISLKSIVRYYWNENIFYLLVILFVNQLLTKYQNFICYVQILKQKDNNSISNLDDHVIISEICAVLVFVYPFLRKINSSTNLIITNYKYLTKLIIVGFIVQISLTVVTYFSDELPFYFLYYFYLICVFSNSFLHVTVIVICNQLLICLQIERCFIKAIGLGIFGVVQDLPAIIFIFQFQPIIIFLIQTQIIIVALVYNFYYLKNRKFTQLEQIVSTQRQIQ